jgi:ankyrin repeat protein
MVAAVETGDVTRVRSLLATDPVLVDAIDQNQLPLVLTAAYRRHKEIVSTLVEAGATLSIFEAAAIGRLDIVQRDVKRWPEVLDEVGLDGFTPLQLACFFGHEEIALWLINQGAKVNIVSQNRQRISPIHAAAASGNLTILRSLLEHGADANARQQNDFTALHTAADSGDLSMIQLVLEHGAQTEAVTEDGRTPLDLAVAKGHDDAASLLR